MGDGRPEPAAHEGVFLTSTVADAAASVTGVLLRTIAQVQKSAVVIQVTGACILTGLERTSRKSCVPHIGKWFNQVCPSTDGCSSGVQHSQVRTGTRFTGPVQRHVHSLPDQTCVA